MNFTGAAIVAGISGWPVKHSRSPRIHNFWLKKYKINGVYVPFPVEPSRALEAFRALPALGITGLNVTVPNKEKAYQAMDEVDPMAKRLKAVNTITVRNGLLYGTNTDAFGFQEALREKLPKWGAKASPAVVLGAGGAARSIVAALQEEGVSDISIVNRTTQRAAALCKDLGGRLTPVVWNNREKALQDAKLLVNTTTLGMNGQPALSIDLAALHPDAMVCDIVYTPIETLLLAQARERGILGVDGLGMLLHQARPGFKAWFGPDPEVDETLRDHVLADLLIARE